jgi:hypothetical protein
MSSDTEEEYERRRLDNFLQIEISNSTACKRPLLLYHKSSKVCLKTEKIEFAIKINIGARETAYSNSSNDTNYPIKV